MFLVTETHPSCCSRYDLDPDSHADLKQDFAMQDIADALARDTFKQNQAPQPTPF